MNVFKLDFSVGNGGIHGENETVRNAIAVLGMISIVLILSNFIIYIIYFTSERIYTRVKKEFIELKPHTFNEPEKNLTTNYVLLLLPRFLELNV